MAHRNHHVIAMRPGAAVPEHPVNLDAEQRARTTTPAPTESARDRRNRLQRERRARGK